MISWDWQRIEMPLRTLTEKMLEELAANAATVSWGEAERDAHYPDGALRAVITPASRLAAPITVFLYRNSDVVEFFAGRTTSILFENLQDVARQDHLIRELAALIRAVACGSIVETLEYRDDQLVRAAGRIVLPEGAERVSTQVCGRGPSDRVERLEYEPFGGKSST